MQISTARNASAQARLIGHLVSAIFICLIAERQSLAIWNNDTNQLSSQLSSRDWVGQVLNNSFKPSNGIIETGTGSLIQTPYSPLQGRLVLTASHVFNLVGQQSHIPGAVRYGIQQFAIGGKTYDGLGINAVGMASGVDIGLILLSDPVNTHPPAFADGYSPILNWA